MKRLSAAACLIIFSAITMVTPREAGGATLSTSDLGSPVSMFVVAGSADSLIVNGGSVTSSRRSGAFNSSRYNPDSERSINHTQAGSPKSSKTSSGTQEVVQERDLFGVRVQSIFTTLALSFGFLFLVLFFFLPRDRAYLDFALLMLTFGAALFLDYQDDFSDVGWYIHAHRAFIAAGLIFGLRFLYALFLPQPPKFFALFVVGVVVAGALAVWRPEENMKYLIVMVIVQWAESIRVFVGAIGRRERGAWYIAAGFAVFFVASLYDILLDTGVIEPLYNMYNGYQFGFLGLCLGSAIYLAQGVSVSNKELIGHEVRIREEALERKLLDAEMARKTKELDDARVLQLSMLPSDLPSSVEFEIAAYMNPASEVGGDYYDFASNRDGSLTVAIGDATGHGLKAGIMVAIAKSLFVGLSDSGDIRTFFNNCTRVLKQMNLGNLFMGLSVLRLKRNSIVASSAGMPPILVYRSATDSVESVLLKGMPLGAFNNFNYQQYENSIEAEDVILLMSDGFSELFNPNREMLGDDAVIKLFRESAKGSPQETIDSLVASADNWQNGHPQEDDITFVVIKAL